MRAIVAGGWVGTVAGKTGGLLRQKLGEVFLQEHLWKLRKL
ncbi:MAG: hypothetical protein WAO10_21890 [Candidatus Sulfotelmatobacter sp.]